MKIRDIYFLQILTPNRHYDGKYHRSVIVKKIGNL